MPATNSILLIYRTFRSKIVVVVSKNMDSRAAAKKDDSAK